MFDWTQGSSSSIEFDVRDSIGKKTGKIFPVTFLVGNLELDNYYYCNRQWLTIAHEMHMHAEWFLESSRKAMLSASCPSFGCLFFCAIHCISSWDFFPTRKTELDEQSEKLLYLEERITCNWCCWCNCFSRIITYTSTGDCIDWIVLIKDIESIAVSFFLDLRPIKLVKMCAD